MAQQLASLGLDVGQVQILGQAWQEQGVTQSCLVGSVGIRDVSTMTKALQRLARPQVPDCFQEACSYV
jgi:hypothetical protein